MSSPVVRLAAAEVTAAAARERLTSDLAELQARLDPKLLARAAVEQVREARAVGTASARRNPGVVAGAATVAALVLLRRPLRRLFRRRPKVYAAAKAPEPARLPPE